MSELAAFSSEAPEPQQSVVEALSAQLKMAREEVQNVRTQLTAANSRAAGEASYFLACTGQTMSIVVCRTRSIIWKPMVTERCCDRAHRSPADQPCESALMGRPVAVTKK